ncbi:MAG: carbohydrate ABC transporter permease [Treponema sp.]|jgi:multiple sugar transport system permease protein/cellobiose transport system permease protein|nr:carbohydrate ABC transporter permease [Treponema sp.]
MKWNSGLHKYFSILINLILVILATVNLIPFILMFVMSTQDNHAIFSGLTFIPGRNLAKNFQSILAVHYFRSLFNSIIVAVCSMMLTVFFSAMAGFAFAKYRFRFKKLAFNTILATMLVPMEIGLVAFVLEMRILHLSQTFLPLILPNIANAFGVFLMNAFMQEAVPFEIMESGRIDGCNDFGVFLRLVFPIIRPAAFTLALISFLNSWNAYLLPMVMINNPRMFTIPLVIAALGNQFVADYGARILGIAVGVLPILLIFVFFSKYITEGLTAGAVKG